MQRITRWSTERITRWSAERIEAFLVLRLALSGKCAEDPAGDPGEKLDIPRDSVIESSKRGAAAAGE